MKPGGVTGEEADMTDDVAWMQCRPGTAGLHILRQMECHTDVLSPPGRIGRVIHEILMETIETGIIEDMGNPLPFIVQ